MTKLLVNCLIALIALILIVPPAWSEGWNVEPLGSLYDYWDGVYDIALSGSYASVASGATGLRLVDLSDPANPIQLGSCNLMGSARGVEVVGNHAFVAAYNGGVRIVDITTPGNIIEIGSLTFPGYVYDVAVAGNYAYLVGSSGVGFSVVDISDPAHPELVNSLTFSGDDICLSGNFAYVAGSGGMAIFNISNPFHPAQVGFYNSPGYPSDVAISGSYAYLPEYSPSVLRIVNVSNPAQPIEAGSLPLAGSPSAVNLTGSYALVASWGQGLYVLDLSNPVNPVIINQCGYPGTREVTISGTQVCTGVDFGIQFFDVTNPILPILEGELHSIGVVNDVVIQGSLAYVAAGNRGLRIVDVSNPLAPQEVGYDSTVYVNYVVVSGNYAYLIGASNDLRIENVADPAHPSLIATCPLPDTPSDLAVQGNYVYLAEENAGMGIVDVSTPVNPVPVGLYANPATMYVAVSGNYAYLTAFCYRNNMHKVDISNPANPVQVAYYHDSNLWGMSVVGDYAYVGGGSAGLRIFNAGGTGFSPLGVCNTPGSAMDVSVSGDFAYVADGSGGLRVIEVSNPANPVERGYFDTDGSVIAATSAGNLAYVADTYSLRIFDCRDALSPVTVTVEPLNPPIVIPASGGSFSYNITLVNEVSTPALVEAWVMVRLPNQSWFGPMLGPLTLTLPGNANITRERTQNVPGSAPAGIYWYEVRLGDYPGAIWDTSGFAFTKSGSGDGDPGLGNWANSGQDFGESDAPFSIPYSSLLTSIHPNPFNPSTVASFELRVPSHVSLKVYDTTGRLVITLVDEWREAGTHEVTFNGTILTSGIYLYSLQAGGETATGKMLLLK